MKVFIEGSLECSFRLKISNCAFVAYGLNSWQVTSNRTVQFLNSGHPKLKNLKKCSAEHEDQFDLFNVKAHSEHLKGVGSRTGEQDNGTH